MKLSVQGHHGRCTVCGATIECNVGSINTDSYPPTFLCPKCASSGVLGELLGSCVADTIANATEDAPGLDPDAVLKAFSRKFGEAVAR